MNTKKEVRNCYIVEPSGRPHILNPLKTCEWQLSHGTDGIIKGPFDSEEEAKASLTRDCIEHCEKNPLTI